MDSRNRRNSNNSSGYNYYYWAVIKAGTWLYNTIVDWFVTRAEIKAAKLEIPSRLKDKNGEVDLGHFNNKVKGRTAYKEKGGWEIDKDHSGHKGSKWKLKKNLVKELHH